MNIHQSVSLFVAYLSNTTVCVCVFVYWGIIDSK